MRLHSKPICSTGVVICIVLSMSACGQNEKGSSSASKENTSSNSTTEPSPPTDTPEHSSSAPKLDDATLAAGVKAYKQGMCSKCHGEHGSGSERGPDLTDSEWGHGDGSLESIKGILISGVPKDKLLDKNRRFGMNPATNLIKDEAAISALAAYVMSLSQPE